MNVWAHRGCSYLHPENTLSSFSAAGELPITGIELDVQLSRDGHVVVIHDERVDRTTDGFGWVGDLTLSELKALRIEASPESGLSVERIPTLDEVLDLLEVPCRRRGLLVNVELKTSEVRYAGIEEKTLALVRAHGLERSVVWSSFCPDSVRIMRELDPGASTGMLGQRASECVRLAVEVGADAIHPFIRTMDLNPRACGWTGPVRVWNMGPDEPFFPDGGPVAILDVASLEAQGVTDVFTNVPELYVEEDPASSITIADALP